MIHYSEVIPDVIGNLIGITYLAALMGWVTYRTLSGMAKPRRRVRRRAA